MGRTFQFQGSRCERAERRREGGSKIVSHKPPPSNSVYTSCSMSRPSLLPFLLKSAKGKAPLRLLACSPSLSPSTSSSLHLLRSSSSTSTTAPSLDSSASSRSITPRSGDVAVPASNPSSHFVPAKPKAWKHPVRLNVSETLRPLPNIMVSRLRIFQGGHRDRESIELICSPLVARSLHRLKSTNVRPSLLPRLPSPSFPPLPFPSS